MNMAAAARRFLIFGAPGSGKGTISARIVRDFGLVHISTGDLLRTHIARGTDVGKAAAAVINAGGLVSDETMISLVDVELAGLVGKSWLLDGFPRTLPQATALDAALRKRTQPLDAVLSLDVPHSVIIDRIKGRYVHLPSGRVYNTDYSPPKRAGVDDVTGEPLTKRDDDTEAVMSTRLNKFQKTVDPILAYYGKGGKNALVHQFAGSTSDEIYSKIKPMLSKLFGK